MVSTLSVSITITRIDCKAHARRRRFRCPEGKSSGVNQSGEGACTRSAGPSYCLWKSFNSLNFPLVQRNGLQAHTKGGSACTNITQRAHQRHGIALPRLLLEISKRRTTCTNIYRSGEGACTEITEAAHLLRGPGRYCFRTVVFHANQ